MKTTTEQKSGEPDIPIIHCKHTVTHSGLLSHFQLYGMKYSTAASVKPVVGMCTVLCTMDDPTCHLKGSLKKVT